jgi:hypothetical protein
MDGTAAAGSSQPEQQPASRTAAKKCWLLMTRTGSLKIRGPLKIFGHLAHTKNI